MRKIYLIFMHYFKRALLDWIGLLFLVLLPLAMVLLNVYVFRATQEQVLINGYCITSTQVSLSVMVMFQFFGGMYVNEWLHDDFKSEQRWRLLSAPVSLNKFILSSAIASWLFTMVQGLLIIAVTAIFFNAYWGNYLFWIPALFLLSAISQFMFIIIGLFAKKKKTSQTIGFIIIFAMQAITGLLGNFGVRLTEIFAKIPTPMNAGINVINYSGLTNTDNRLAVENMLILTVTLAILVVAALIIGRRRPI
jgi:ABC-2 type transport system permease protein